MTGFVRTGYHLYPLKTKYIIITAPRANYDLTGLNISINGTPLNRVAYDVRKEIQNFLVYILMIH